MNFKISHKLFKTVIHNKDNVTREILLMRKSTETNSITLMNR